MYALPLAFHIIFHMRLSLALIIIFIKLLLLLLLPARSLPGVFFSFYFCLGMLSRSRCFYLRDVYETCSANYELLFFTPSLSFSRAISWMRTYKEEAARLPSAFCGSPLRHCCCNAPSRSLSRLIIYHNLWEGASPANEPLAACHLTCSSVKSLLFVAPSFAHSLTPSLSLTIRHLARQRSYERCCCLF